MPSRIDLVKIWRHPRTGVRLSQEAAQRYNKRAKKRIKPELWLVERMVVGDLSGVPPLEAAYRKKVAGRVRYQARLTQVEKIVKSSSIRERKIRQTLANHRVFSRLWEDFEVPNDIQRRGGIRITVSGFVDGRRIKEVIHLAWSRSHWLTQFHSEASAKEEFKSWLTASILTNLRRRGLRVSNPIESARRIRDLSRNRQGMLDMLDMETRADRKAGWMERIKWATKSIAAQKKSRQVTHATIKIDKII